MAHTLTPRRQHPAALAGVRVYNMVRIHAEIEYLIARWVSHLVIMMRRQGHLRFHDHSTACYYNLFESRLARVSKRAT